MGGRVIMAMDLTFGPSGTPVDSIAGRSTVRSPVRDARLSWRVSALFILGVSLICWGAIIMTVRALIG